MSSVAIPNTNDAAPLGQHLQNGVLATEENPFEINTQQFVKVGLGGFSDGLNSLLCKTLKQFSQALNLEWGV